MNHIATKHNNGSESHTWESAGFTFELEMTEESSPERRSYSLLVRAPENTSSESFDASWQPNEPLGMMWLGDGVLLSSEELALNILFEAHQAIAAVLGEDAYPLSAWADPFVLDWEAYFDPTVPPDSDDDPDDFNKWWDSH